jgi:hypothetical protein
MRSLEAIERELDLEAPEQARADDAARLLRLAEEVLEAWLAARGKVPAREQREGFRLLALHHQGAEGVPSFNACRETCREIAYHYNLMTSGAGEHPARDLAMMGMLARHLVLFVGGKMQVEGLGEFCCASRPIREDRATMA